MNLYIYLMTRPRGMSNSPISSILIAAPSESIAKEIAPALVGRDWPIFADYHVKLIGVTHLPQGIIHVSYEVE